MKPIKLYEPDWDNEINKRLGVFSQLDIILIKELPSKMQMNKYKVNMKVQ